MTFAQKTIFYLLLMLCLALPAGAQPLRDPTRPPEGRPAAGNASLPVQHQWRLSSILISAERRIAVVDGQAVQVGQTVSGAHLVAIEPQRVLLRHGQKEIALHLTKTGLKTPAGIQEEKSKP